MIEYLELIASKSSTIDEAIKLIKEDVEYTVIPHGYTGMKPTGVRDRAVVLEHKKLGFKITYPVTKSTLTAKANCDDIFNVYLDDIYND